MNVELAQQFDELGIEPSADVISKCMELCISYHVEDAVEFVEQWTAFSLSSLSGAEPTVAHLLDFERKVFQAKRDKELAAACKKKSKYPASMTRLGAASDASPLAVYGVESDMMDDYMGKTDTGGGGGGGDEDILDSYNVQQTPKAKSHRVGTPARHSEALFTPASYSPISSGTPRTHTAAPGAGKVVYTFGNPALISAAQWASTLQPKVLVQQLLLHNGEPLSAAKSKYLFDGLREKLEIASDRVFQIGQSLCRRTFGADAVDYELSQVDVPSQGNTKTIGTIICDHDGPLDASSTLLVGSDEMRCRTVRLNFANAKSAAVFPGQTVMVSGVNPRGDVFMVEEILAERDVKPPTTPHITEQLSFVIATGPFTHKDDLVYDPLHDLMSYLKEQKPDVVILVGPFLEAEHKLISENITLAETFDSFFEKMIAGIIDIIGTQTTVLVVASHLDANADPVYPTMPAQLRKTYPNVHLLADPSIVDLNGLSIGVTSTDIFDHLLKYEFTFNGGDKVKRVVNYLLQQGSFYPLSPPIEDEMCFDSILASKYANIEQTPNILILPSDQKCFIRVINGCLVINPGRLSDRSGGTFARFVIKAPDLKEESSIYNYTACQIRKV